MKSYIKILMVILTIFSIFFIINPAFSQSLKGYTTFCVEEVKVNPSVPQMYGPILQDAIYRQVARYSGKYGWFNNFSKGKPATPNGVLIAKAQITSYSPPTPGKRIGKSFIPGGEWFGSCSVQFEVQFIDAATGKIIFTKRYDSKSTGTNDTVEYAIERGGEYVAKTIYRHWR